MKDKFKLYEEAGVLEYWAVAPSNFMVLRYELRDGEYFGLRPETRESSQIKSARFPEFSIDGEVIFRE